MNITFSKYQGTGNDFVMIDNRSGFFPKSDSKLVEKLCDRKFGIGADGLILLENSKEYDARMTYYNADGHEGTMCGNGGRCFVAFEKELGIIENSTTFTAVDGIHLANIDNELVNLKMMDVNSIESNQDHYFLNTGSPHHVEFRKNISNMDVYSEGARIRNGAPYFEEGSNVNFAEKSDKNTLKVRTFERGVEDETLSCGTGVTAVAISAFNEGLLSESKAKIITEGGNLEVSFEKTEKGYEEIYLKGPATFVFKGSIEGGI